MNAQPAAAVAVTLRQMRTEDLSAVLQVERAAYLTPWSEGIFRDCLRVHYCCLVAECRMTLIGHGVMSVAAGECHLLNLCVHPGFHRQGLGRRLLRRLLHLARRHEADTAFLEVRASNRGAMALYQSEGFDEIGRRQGYYPHVQQGNPKREDAVVMARAL
ncbi:MAG: ribosomal-protein-alanine N-acetyltransferase [Chromatiaceae bacterium]|nr:MAG: ribosomal-protein-alanine N-acetyltransferase [Chromatiaceae bacterium]